MSNLAYGTPSVQHTVQQPVFCLTTAELPNPLSKMSRKQFSVFPLVQNCSRMESKGFFFLVLYSRWARAWHPLRPAHPQSYVTENELIVKVLVKTSYQLLGSCKHVPGKIVMEYLERRKQLLIQYQQCPCPVRGHAVTKTLGISDYQMKIHTIPKATVATRHLRVQVEDRNLSCITHLVFCVREAWNMLTESL